MANIQDAHTPLVFADSLRFFVLLSVFIIKYGCYCLFFADGPRHFTELLQRFTAVLLLKDLALIFLIGFLFTCLIWAVRDDFLEALLGHDSLAEEAGRAGTIHHARFACKRAGAAPELERRVGRQHRHLLLDLGAQEPLHVILSPGLLGHDPAELSDADVPVAVDVRRIEQLLYFIFAHISAECSHPHFHFFFRDQSITVIIKLLEGPFQLSWLLDR